jgi:hypothetical protein
MEWPKNKAFMVVIWAFFEFRAFFNTLLAMKENTVEFIASKPAQVSCIWLRHAHCTVCQLKTAWRGQPYVECHLTDLGASSSTVPIRLK